MLLCSICPIYVISDGQSRGHVRVSVDEEGDGCNASILSPIEASRAHGARHGIELVDVFQEPNISGTKLHRRQFDAIIARATSSERPARQMIVPSL